MAHSENDKDPEVAENSGSVCSPLPDDLALRHGQVSGRPSEIAEELLHVLPRSQH